ncbi:IclR family transcriptional regulator [Caulobacter segnis]|nr:helix-turn-helix domain-containing protein [Caulobacter segnis]
MVSATRGRRPETSSDKTLSVMDLFTPDRPEWTVEAACLALGQSESTVYRYFRSLTSAGLIFSIRPGRYLLGPGIVHYDRQLRSSDPLLRAAEPTFAKLSHAYGVPSTVFICRIYRDHVMAMHEHRSGAPPLPEGVFARGRLAPLFCGPPALAMLAFMEVRAVRAMFQKSAGEDADWLEIKRRMRTIRAVGYAVSLDDPDPGVILLAAPLKQQDGGIAGGLCLALAHTAENTALIGQAGEDLVDEASKMAERSLIFSNT